MAIFRENISIKKNFQTFLSASQRMIVTGKDELTTFFLKKGDSFCVKNKEVDVNGDDDGIFRHCNIQTPHIRKKVYTGDTKIIEINGKDDSFRIPYETILRNGKSNYIHTNELHGILTEKILSSRPFEINDDDLFLSGDNLLVLHKNNYIKTTKNAHLRQIKKKDSVYDIRSELMEYFGKEHICKFAKDVIFTTGDSVVKGQLAKVYLDKDDNIESIFMKDDVSVRQDNNSARSDYGYFDVETNMIALYKNVVLNSNDGVGSDEFYVYDISDKTSIAFSENVILNTDDAKRMYRVFSKLAIDVPLEDKIHIERIINDNARNRKNADSVKENDGDNEIIDRSKRVRAKIFG